MLASVAAGQQAPDNRVKVLTVCEVLSDVGRYADTAVAIVGRMRYGVSLVDHNEYLSQDGCKRPVITHGHVWSNEIQVWAFAEEGMPKPPTDKPTFVPNEVATKIAEVRKTTKLSTHTRPALDSQRHPVTVVEPNDWAVVYGRVVRSPQLDENCGRRGCGGDNVPLLILAEQDQVHIVRADGTPQRVSERLP
jgi:hypothetical protein